MQPQMQPQMQPYMQTQPQAGVVDGSWSGPSPVFAEQKYQRQSIKPRSVLLWVGSLILLLTMLVPLLDAMRLLNDPTYVFFMGRKWPIRIIQLCFGCIFGWMIAVLLLFGCAREETKTDNSVYMIVSVVVTILGLSLLMISAPMRLQVEEAYTELFTNCHFGSRTTYLYDYAVVLQGIRARPSCAAEKTVESCEGYKESMPYTGFLKQLEHRYKCSGFCYGNSTEAASFAAVATEPFSPPINCREMPQECIDAMDTASTDPNMPGGCCGCRFINQNCPESCMEVGSTCTPYLECACQEVVNESSPLAAKNVAKAEKMAKREREANGTAAKEAEAYFAVAGVEKGAFEAPDGEGTLAGALQRVAVQREEADELAYQRRWGDLEDRASTAPERKAQPSALMVVAAAPAIYKKRLPRTGTRGRRETSLAQENINKPLPGGGNAGWGEANSTNIGAKGVYVPSLFTDAEYRASCDGMAARDLKYSALDIANVLYWEGVVLLFSVILSGFLRICGLCVGEQTRRPAKRQMSRDIVT